MYLNENLNIINNNKPIEKTLGTLTLYYYSCDQNGPAFNLKCKWRRNCDKEYMDISIDLCFVMRFYKPLHEMIHPEDLECQKYYEFAQKCGSVLVMPCKERDSCVGGGCFRLIFSEAELLLCKELSNHHKKCYKILKYLINGIPNMAKPHGIVSNCLDIVLNGISRKVSIRANKIVSCLSRLCDKSTAFHSYALKLIVYHHHYTVQCKEKNCVASCIDQILHDILDILNPGIFSWSIGKLPKLYTEIGVEISPLDQFLDERVMVLKKQLERVSNAIYNYETFKIESVNCIWTKRAETIMLLVFFFFFIVEDKWLEVALFRDMFGYTCVMELLILIIETILYRISSIGSPLQTIRRWWFRTKNHSRQLQTFVISMFLFYVGHGPVVTFTDALGMSCLFICARILLLYDLQKRSYDITTLLTVLDGTFMLFISLLLALLMYLSKLSEWNWFLPK